jgi:hypothetical protein
VLNFLNRNAYPSVRNNFDPDSNVTEKSELHSEKQPSPKASKDEGIMISVKLVSLNVLDSIRDNIDPGSNFTEKGDLH